MNDVRSEIILLLEEAMADPLSSIRLQQPLEAYVDKLLSHAELAAWYAGARLRGFVAFYANAPDRKEAFVSMVAVASSNRRQRVAASLLEAVLASVSARGFCRCALEVHASNTPAIALYEQLGFEHGTVCGDVLTMWRAFGPARVGAANWQGMRSWD